MIRTKPLSWEITPLVQRQTEEEEEELQMKGLSGSAPEVTSGIGSRLSSSREAGQPLSDSSRAYFEPRFGADFSGVRVHTGSDAVQMNRDLNAQAFTLGRDVYFGSGRYGPGTSSGKRLLAHELTHVVQQTDTKASVQRQHIADTGWRYKPPASVKRSIVEIQGVVGTTPDGIYGPNTREFVKNIRRN